MAILNIDLKLLIGKANANLDKLAKQAEEARRKFKGLRKGVDSVRSNMNLLAGAAAGVGLFKLGRAAISLGAGSLSAAGKMETLTTQFEVLTQSSDKAKNIMEDLVEFTAKTPFQLDGVAKAGQRLLGFGVEVDSIQDKLQVLGDVSAASGADLSEMALIFGQVKASGKLMGDRLLQLRERAIPIGPAIAKSMGISEKAVDGWVSRGKVSFADFEKAFESLNKKGEFAFGGMIKRSATLEGRTSTLNDNLNLLSSDAGTKLLPTFKGLITAFTIIVEQIRNSSSVMSFFGEVSSNIPSIIDSIATALTVVNNVIQSTRKFLNLAVAGFNAFAAGAIDIVIALNDARIALSGFMGIDTAPMDAQNAKLKDIRDTFEDVGVEALQSNDKITKSQNDLNAKIAESSKVIIKSIDTEIKAAEVQANKKVEADNKIIRSGKALTAEQLKDMEDRKVAQEKLNEQLAAARDMTQQQKEAVRLFDSESEILFQEEKLIALEEFFTREQEATLQATINAAKSETEKQLIIEGIITKGLQSQLKAKQKASDQEIADEISGDKKKAANRKKAGQIIATLASSNNHTLATIGKAAAITQIAIDTPVAISQTLKAFPAPLNFVLAATVGAAMAAQAANVAGINFADGGFVPGRSFSGDNVAANVNSGEAVLNSQQQRSFMRLAEGGGGGSQEIVIRNVIELDGQQIAESVSRSVADGLELGEVV